MLRKQMFVFVIVSAMGTAVLGQLSATSGRRVMLISQSDETGSAYSMEGKENIKLREVRCTQVASDGKVIPLRLFLLFEPRSGAFSWIVTDDLSGVDGEVQTNLFKNYRAVFLKDGNLITFTAQMTPLLLRVQDSRGQASSIDDAQSQAVTAVSELRDPPRDIELTQPVHTIRLNRLNPEFVHAPGTATFGTDPKVIQVRREGQQWIVVLKARWTEAITLDADYNFVSHEVID